MNVKNFLSLLVSPQKLINNLIQDRVEQTLLSIHNKNNFVPIDESTPEDIFLVGYPKSGNTFLQHIVSHLYYNLNYNQSRSLIETLVPDIHSSKYYSRLNDTCFFKSHGLPNDRYKNVIYIYRDGRDALVSYFHMLNGKGKKISIDELFIKDLSIYPCMWHEHIENWLQNPYKANILYVKYEDLIRDPCNTFESIAKFIGVNYTDETINYSISQTSFGMMQELENSDKFWNKRKKDKGWKEGKNFVRKGKIGSYKEEVPDNVLNNFYTFAGPTLARLGYSL